MVLPGSCCPFPGLVPLPQAGPLRPGAPRRHRPCRPCPLLLFRSLLGLGLLQTGLGCALVALCFGALSLSSAPQVKNACPLWAGSSAILCGILGLTTWKKPMRLLVNLFVLLCMISFMLNVTGLILGCQGIQFVSGVPRCNLMDMDENKTCFCCEELHPTTCTEAKAVLKLYHVKSCRAAHLLLKVLLALSALNALTATVCFTVAALHYLLTLASRRFCTDEFEIEGEDRNLDPDDFVPPVPPPSYFATFNSCTPPSHSTPVSDVISLHYIYVTRIRGVEVYCPLDPPPPYETVCSLKSSEQGGVLQINGVEEVDSGEVSDRQSSQAEEIEEPSSRVSLSSSNASCVPAGVNRRAFHPLLKCSKSDPVLLHCQLPPGTVLSSETATLDVNPPNAVTLRKSSRARASRGRPQSLIDYQSYMDTKRRVAWILEQSCSMSPDIRDLVENIKSVLKSDEKHMAEAVTSATFLEQVMTTPDQQDTSLRVHVLPSRLHPGLLHLESCGDLSTFTTEGEQLAERRIQRAEHERPHSVIGVVRETVL
ncbi:endosomal transmembrane epsin interactor 1 isoform X2 [Serinus canaria]|uniref:endosomal transmembrane epsin interactor 1 isoform X2 n=1 Tax=Serinus canaria TaxID=9135 RepID=UPI0021CCBF3E|nr:endosomal transmembrane epsin interactor 1 isoform X2 [Serinus canaria]